MAANSEIIRIGKLAKFGKLTLTRKEDDLVIIYDSRLRKASLAKRQDLKAAGDNFIGRALDNNDVYNVRDKRGYFRDEIRFSDLGWYASWQRGRGRCNDIYSPKALIKKEERPQQQEEERRQRLKDEKPQQQKKDSQKDLHVQLESQISSCSSGDPPPPYAP